MDTLKVEAFYDGADALFIQVEQTIFKVSGQRLSASEIFSSMAQLGPASGEHADGCTAERPLVLDLCAAEFSTFLRIAHAWPHEVNAFIARADDADKCGALLSVARVGHFLLLNRDADWALADALRIVHANPNLVTQGLALRLLNIASRWGDGSPFLVEAEQILQDLLMADRYTDLVDIIHELESLGSQKLLGVAYYRLMLKGNRAWTDERLTTSDLRRLYTGYVAVCETIWEIVRNGLRCSRCHRVYHDCSFWSEIAPKTPSQGIPDIARHVESGSYVCCPPAGDTAGMQRCNLGFTHEFYDYPRAIIPPFPLFDSRPATPAQGSNPVVEDPVSSLSASNLFALFDAETRLSSSQVSASDVQDVS